MLTSLTLLRIIKTAEWWRYTGAADQGYATAGITGPGAISLRCPVPLSVTDPAQFIEYRTVGTKTWHCTGYLAIMRYDHTRDHAEDGDGYEFIPYEIRALQLYS